MRLPVVSFLVNSSVMNGILHRYFPRNLFRFIKTAFKSKPKFFFRLVNKYMELILGRLEKGIIGKDFKKIIARSRGENN